MCLKSVVDDGAANTVAPLRAHRHGPAGPVGRSGLAVGGLVRAVAESRQPAPTHDRRGHILLTRSLPIKMTTEEAFIKVLQMHGIEHAFGIIGSAFMPVSDLFPKAGITFWDVAHETNGGLMADGRSEEHTSELQSRLHLVCRLLLEKKKRGIQRATNG